MVAVRPGEGGRIEQLFICFLTPVIPFFMAFLPVQSYIKQALKHAENATKMRLIKKEKALAFP